MRPQNNLRGPVEPRLNVQEIGLVGEHGGPEIDDLDPGLELVLEHDVFGFEVGVDHLDLLEVGQRVQDLDGECADVGHVQGGEVVCL